MANKIDTLLILGASGDLTARLLLPGLAELLASSRGRSLDLIGVGSDDLDTETWRERVRTSFSESGSSGQILDDLAAKTTYLSADVTDAEQLQKVIDACDGTPAMYFALPPAVTEKACETLREVNYPKGLTLVMEKPFGSDRKSAHALNELVASLVPEEQVHRVDHFLGRSEVLNLLGTRFANRIFEPLWSNEHVAGIEIVYDEDLTLENRAGYYDRAGALVDMIQSHLLQVMAVLMMEPPSTLGEKDVRDSKAQLLRATHTFHSAHGSSRRARYTAGQIGDREVPAYVDESGVDPQRDTETLAEVTLEVRTWRWAGVPVTLRSGKSLGTARKQVIVTFKDVPQLPVGLGGKLHPDRLVIGLKPANLSLDIMVNGEGDPFVVDPVSLKTDLNAGDLDAYGEVLEGVLDGDPTLSVRGDTAEECWRIVAPMLQAWQADKVPMDSYPAGSDGPADWAAPLTRPH